MPTLATGLMVSTSAPRRRHRCRWAFLLGGILALLASSQILAFTPSGRARRQLIRRSAASDSQEVDGEDEDGPELQLARERLSRLLDEGDTACSTVKVEWPPGEAWPLPDSSLDERGLPKVGTVLVANATTFFADVDNEDDTPSNPAATVRTGLRPMPNGGRLERGRIPAVLITKRGPHGTEGILLGIWSGRLMGDEEIGKEEFMTRPLYCGGLLDSAGPRLQMLHSYPDMPGARSITEDGLAFSTDYGECCDWIRNGPGSSLRFKFFFGSVFWPTYEEREMRQEASVWTPVKVSLDLILREPDSAFEDPLWVQIVEKVGGELCGLARKYDLLSG
mmetsp:Transcript_76964/g.135645  ORF Transcript_76964/g.135645 Transcript_76964/m.135645 type:complete len:335 (-) Transcript_76964:91-1095(-)